MTAASYFASIYVRKIRNFFSIHDGDAPGPVDLRGFEARSRGKTLRGCGKGLQLPEALKVFFCPVIAFCVLLPVRCIATRGFLAEKLVRKY